MSDTDQLTHAIERLTCVIAGTADVRVILDRIAQLETKLMATQAELAADLKLVSAQQKKTGDEIKALQASMNVLKDKITDLEEVIANGGGATTELTDAVAEVKAQAQVVDDLIPDPVTPPPVP